MTPRYVTRYKGCNAFCKKEGAGWGSKIRVIIILILLYILYISLTQNSESVTPLVTRNVTHPVTHPEKFTKREDFFEMLDFFLKKH